MQFNTGLKASPALLLAGFLFLTGCGNDLAAGIIEEQVSEEELVKHDGTGEAPAQEKMQEPDFTVSEMAQVLAKYDHLDPKRLIDTELLKKAVAYFEANQAKFPNKNYMSVIDFSKSSTKSRFFIINMKTGSVWAVHTSHGRGSDPDHNAVADTFSNVSGSKKSSLGAYKTAETYQGKHGYSMRLDGLSSTNSNARARAIVVHAANYVSEASVKQGRSEGCPAVAPAHSKKLIDTIKGGSLIYAGLSGVR